MMVKGSLYITKGSFIVSDDVFHIINFDSKRNNESRKVVDQVQLNINSKCVSEKGH